MTINVRWISLLQENFQFRKATSVSYFVEILKPKKITDKNIKKSKYSVFSYKYHLMNKKSEQAKLNQRHGNKEETDRDQKGGGMREKRRGRS